VSNASVPEAGKPNPGLRQLTLRFDGKCLRCGKSLLKGTQALYDFSIHRPQCIACDSRDDPGIAGGSAEREFQRRKAKQAAVNRTLGKILGDLVPANQELPQTTLAWERGAIGERRLAEALKDVRDSRLLHDRRLPNTKANVDHIVVAPAGVFVVDAKLHKGLIEIRDVGQFHRDMRLYVRGRDRSWLAEQLLWQVASIQRLLSQAGRNRSLTLVPVVCFVDGTWKRPLVPPVLYQGVWFTDSGSIAWFMSGKPVLDAQIIDEIHHELAIALPSR